MLGQKLRLVTLRCTALYCAQQGFSRRQAAVISVRPGAILCQTQFFPAGSKKHPLQDTSEPISQVCGASESTFKKRKKCHTKSSVRDGG